MNIGSRIKELRKSLGLSVSALSIQIQEKEHRIRDIENNKQNIPPEVIIKLRNILNLNIDWLLTGEGEMFLKDEQSINNINFCSDDCVEIGYLEDMVASAGGGADSSSINIKMVKVSKFMLQEFKVVNFKKANLIKVFGDSMEPIFKSGDIAVVERVDSIDDVKNGNIVIATINNDVYIKRVEKDPFRKRVVFKSENSLYSDIIAEDEELDLVKINSIVKGKMRVF